MWKDKFVHLKYPQIFTMLNCNFISCQKYYLIYNKKNCSLFFSQKLLNLI